MGFKNLFSEFASQRQAAFIKQNYLMTHPQLMVSKHMLNLIFNGIKNHQVGRALKRGKLRGKIAY